MLGRKRDLYAGMGKKAFMQGCFATRSVFWPFEYSMYVLMENGGFEKIPKLSQ